MDISKIRKEMSKGGTFLIKFYKVNGELRTMLATTDFDKLNAKDFNFTPPKGLRKPNENIMIVWDLQKDAFRSFRPVTVVKFRRVSRDLVASWNARLDISAKDLSNKLVTHNLKITFIKADGSKRVMNCTRNHKDLKKFNRNDHVINVWDLDKDEPRNINYDKILKIENSDIKMTSIQKLESKVRSSASKLANFSRKRYGSRYKYLDDPYDGIHSIYDPAGESLVRIDNDGYYIIKNMFDARYIHDKKMGKSGIFPKCKVKNKDGSMLFSGLENVKEFEEVITTGVTCMYSMFSSCTNLVKAPELDTSKVTDMSLLYAQCYKLRSVPNYDVSKVTEAFGMFSQCDSMYDLPRLKFNKKVNKREVFDGFFPNNTKIGKFLLDVYGLDKWYVYLLDKKLLTNALSALGSNLKKKFDTVKQWNQRNKELQSIKDKVRESLRRFKIV